MQVGFKLISPDNEEVKTWGGDYGTCPDVPTSIDYPPGTRTFGAKVGDKVCGATLVAWIMDPPPTLSPPPRTVAEIKGELIDKIKYMAAAILVQTDWQVLRAMEGYKPVKPGTSAERIAARDNSNALEAEVNALNTVEQLEAWRVVFSTGRSK